MDIRPLSIDGVWEITPRLHGDPRGMFTEWYRFDHLAEAVGHPLDLRQANLSVSARGVVRGVHFADVPPGQAKYLTCVRGALLDVVVDLRVGSPTFGRWESVLLDDVERKALYVSEGIGHGFCAQSEDATLVYMCSATYAPGREHTVHPLDPDLAIDWQTDDEPVLSDRDAKAPSLDQARRSGLLPDRATCDAFTRSLGAAGA
ncbi:dTDP-4-dehydrorhamnose 3,5-epimerase [Streptomyces sp. SID3343]|uniref:dTDP-4-dehydrorhamnose 3,5-epimerase family protein n=1 Tax=Streptomyces sp. SID3343 TaxID=2690260 RepID=UPI0013697FB7|nr:dTDP-4-dehydrorhamnose 3,5-epimerase [Streptomyces sp. SID3343]MYW01592.1 dTDP-4-dehydrorhamnose 3,5-epimerase [Streptomyces sp. SID3343]